MAESLCEKKLRWAQEDLLDLERHLEALFRFLPLPLCTFNPPGIITEANRGLEELSGYSLEELVGQDFASLFSAGEIKKIFRSLQQGKKIRSQEVVLLTKQKKKVWVSLSISPKKDRSGKIVGYFAALADISGLKKTLAELEALKNEREKELKELNRRAKMLAKRDKELTQIQKKREKELKELRRSRVALMNILEDVENSRKALMNISEDAEEARRAAEAERDKTKAIITNFADGLLMFDREKKLSLINPQAEIFFNLKAADLINKTALELETFASLKPLMKLLGPELKEFFRKELSIREDLFLEVSAIPVMEAERKLGTLVILHDVTREKRIEKMKTEFVSLAAHQLRTPLSAIKWSLKMLLEGDLGKVTKAQKEFIEKTYRSNERMINLINDLLNVTRIEEGRYLYKPVLADFGQAVVQFVINAYREEIKKRKIKLELKKPEKKLPRVRIDVEKMRVAMQNFVDNAVRYNRPGGRVTIMLKYAKKEIEVSIEDTGLGIPPNQQERVFNKFFRAENAMKQETEGSGLGLYIAKNIIEAHGGRVWFRSEENKGSTFYFTLPVAKS